MLRFTFPVGPLQCNCSILADEATREAIVVDPGGDLHEITAVLDRERLTVRAIVITHAHIDHVGAAQRLRERTAAPVIMHPGDRELLAALPIQADWLGVTPPPAVQVDEEARDRSTLRLAGAAMEWIHTPGHTQGSLCIWVPQENLLLAGDTLFRDAIGRTDLPGGDGRQILRSIHSRLLPLADETIVIPGHGAPTTIGREKEFNPFLQNR